MSLISKSVRVLANHRAQRVRQDVARSGKHHGGDKDDLT